MQLNFLKKARKRKSKMLGLSAFQLYMIVSGLIFAVYGVIIGLLIHIYKTDQQAQDKSISDLKAEDAQIEIRMNDKLLNQVKASDLKFEDISTEIKHFHHIDKQVTQNTNDIEWLKKDL